MRPQRDCTRYFVRDLGDQHPASSLLVVTLNGGSFPFRVDAYQTKEQEVVGYRRIVDADLRAAYMPVISFSPDLPWMVVDTDYIDFATVHEVQESALVDTQDAIQAQKRYQQVVEAAQEAPTTPQVDPDDVLPQPEPDKLTDFEAWLRRRMEEGPNQEPQA